MGRDTLEECFCKAPRSLASIPSIYPIASAGLANGPTRSGLALAASQAAKNNRQEHVGHVHATCLCDLASALNSIGEFLVLVFPFSLPFVRP